MVERAHQVRGAFIIKPLLNVLVTQHIDCMCRFASCDVPGSKTLRELQSERIMNLRASNSISENDFRMFFTLNMQSAQLLN